ncbi:MAG: hypothetical protein ACE37F_13045 [Nannocystaceae bacterium]|nr:hypothetical protein [bacterium]
MKHLLPTVLLLFASLAACVTASELANPCASANQGLHTRAQNQRLIDACRSEEMAAINAALPACEPGVDAECTMTPEQQEEHEAEQLRRQQALSQGRNPDQKPVSQSPQCVEYRKARAELQAEVARDAEVAFEARKAEMQAVGEAEYFEGRVAYWREHGETLEAAVVQAWEETQRRNTTRADSRSMSAFTAHVDCD